MYSVARKWPAWPANGPRGPQMARVARKWPASGFDGAIGTQWHEWQKRPVGLQKK